MIFVKKGRGICHQPQHERNGYTPRNRWINQAVRPLMCNITKFHCFLTATWNITQRNPITNRIGSKLHCPAIRNPAPIYPTRDEILSRGVNLLSLTKNFKNRLHHISLHFFNILSNGNLPLHQIYQLQRKVKR